MVNAAQVQNNLTELEKVVIAQAATIEKLTKDLKQLQDGQLPQVNMDDIRSEYDAKIIHITSEYEGKIAQLNNDLTISQKVSSQTTIEVVSGFFDKLDKKLTEHMISVAKQLDVIENDKLPGLHDDIQNQNEFIEAGRKAVNELKLVEKSSARPAKSDSIKQNVN